MKFLLLFFKNLLINFTSRKFIVTAIALWYERADFWANAKEIWSFTASPDAQLNAYIQLCSGHRQFVFFTLLAFVGLLTAQTFSASWGATMQQMVSSTFSRSENKTIIVDETKPNKNLREHQE